MVWYKTVVSPLLAHWRYHSLVPCHQYQLYKWLLSNLFGYMKQIYMFNIYVHQQSKICQTLMSILMIITVWCCYNAVHFLQNTHNRPLIAHGVKYAVYFVSSKSHLCSASVIAFLYKIKISWYIGLCYNGTWLYINGLVQERRNSIANAQELILSCTSPSICSTKFPCHDDVSYVYRVSYWNHRHVPPAWISNYIHYTVGMKLLIHSIIQRLHRWSLGMDK